MKVISGSRDINNIEDCMNFMTFGNSTKKLFPCVTYIHVIITLFV